MLSNTTPRSRSGRPEPLRRVNGLSTSDEGHNTVFEQVSSADSALMYDYQMSHNESQQVSDYDEQYKMFPVSTNRKAKASPPFQTSRKRTTDAFGHHTSSMLICLYKAWYFFLRCVFRSNSIQVKSTHTMRTIQLNNPESTPHYPDNTISSTKHTAWTFLPNNLRDQFHHYMNRYFLLIAILQLWPAITPVNPITTWAPLILVLSVNALRDAFDDYKRHKADMIANSRQYEILCESHHEERPSSSIRPGCLLFIREHDSVPCDIVVLKTSSKGGDAGSCYVETSMLDGETDVKPRRSLHVTNQLKNEELAYLSCWLECDPPNADLNRFDGLLKWDERSPPSQDDVVHDSVSSEKSQLSINCEQQQLIIGEDTLQNEHNHTSNSLGIPITAEHLLQQGVILKDTEWVIGVAVYTGPETKLGQNTSKPPTKVGRVDRRINQLTGTIFLTQLCLIIMLGITGIIWNQGDASWYLINSSEASESNNSMLNWIVIPLRFMLLTSMMIPISLRVTLDVAKTFYAFLIVNDSKLYDSHTDIRASCANSDIVEDMGHVGILLTDKTGTLTDNVMVFDRASIEGQEETASELYMRQAAKLALAPLFGIQQPTSSAVDNNTIASTDDTTFIHDNESNKYSQLSDAALFWLTLASCNTVKPVHISEESLTAQEALAANMSPIPNGSRYWIEYQSSSPDEETLVHAAAKAGVAMTHRRHVDDSAEQLTLQLADVSSEEVIDINDEDRQFDSRCLNTKRICLPSISSSTGMDDLSPIPKSLDDMTTVTILHTIPFTSDRKRMSIVVRIAKRDDTSNSDSSQLYLLCKGADDILLPRIHTMDHSKGSTQNLRMITKTHLEAFAGIGLRTLIIAGKPLSHNEYQNWLKKWHSACKRLKGRQQAMEHVADSLERNLRLFGATAVEDALQPGVPETLKQLRAAQIGVWMLTGDKYTTAVQIALAAQLMDKPDLIVSKHPAEISELVDSKQSGDDSCKCNQEPTKPSRSTNLSDYVDSALLVIRGRSRNEVAAELELARQYCILGYGSRRRHSSDGSETSGVHSTTEEFVVRTFNDLKTAPIATSRTIIFEGRALAFALRHYAPLVEYLAKHCQGFICCRASPAQKAELVRLARRLNHITCAIGDGGNDCPMILAANVGIGIAGREGLQAARAADCTIARFRFLSPLLFVHGRLAHYRTAFMSQYCFYKSLILCGIQILYNTQCHLSGCSLLDTFSLTTYNMVYTALPVLLFVLDTDRPLDVLLNWPHLYKESRQDRWISRPAFLGWALRAVIQACVILFVSTYIISSDNPTMTGMNSFTTLSYFTFTILLMVVYSTLALETKRPTWINHLVNGGCFISYFILLGLRSIFTSNSPLTLSELFTFLWSANGFYAIILILAVTVVPYWLLGQFERYRTHYTNRYLRSIPFNV